MASICAGQRPGQRGRKNVRRGTVEARGPTGRPCNRRNGRLAVGDRAPPTPPTCYSANTPAQGQRQGRRAGQEERSERALQRRMTLIGEGTERGRLWCYWAVL